MLVLAGGVGLFFWGLAVFPPPCPPHEFICPPNHGHEFWGGALLLAALMTVVQGVVLVIWGRPSRRGRRW